MPIHTQKRLLVVQVAALGYNLLPKDNQDHCQWAGLSFLPAQSVLPAVTCTAQASFRTASYPNHHGMIANGLFHRQLSKTMFWEQSAHLVDGDRFWQPLRNRRGKVAMLFWQQSMGEQVDILLTPAPVHKHHGGMIQDCYCLPEDLYARLCRKLGRSFKLQHYWGPLASAKVGDWITDATICVMGEDDLSPDLCLTYLPTLDYDLQRYGPDDPRSQKALATAQTQVTRLVESARKHGYEVLVFGDYAIGKARGEAVLPNLALQQAGLLAVRHVRGMAYPVPAASRAIALCDHEIAHVYVRNQADISHTVDVLNSVDGIETIVTSQEMKNLHLDHPNSGELLLIASKGRWMAYPWWTDRKQAPDYASHIDIHNKPGFDPCELFFGWPPMSISQNTSRIRGSHGRTGSSRSIAWASTVYLGQDISNLVELASAVAQWLD